MITGIFNSVGLLNRPRDLLPDNGAHAGAKKTKIHHGQRDVMTVELAEADHHGVVHARLPLVGTQPFRVGGHPREFQHIHARHVSVKLAEGALIREHHDALGSGHREMVIALAADLRIGHEFLAKDHLAASLALHPQTAGDFVLLRLGLGNLRFFFFFEYRHDEPPRVTARAQTSFGLANPKTLAQPTRVAPVGKTPSVRTSAGLGPSRLPLYAARNGERYDLPGSRRAQGLGATVERCSRRKHVIHQDQTFAGESGFIAYRERAAHVLRSCLRAEFRLCRGVFHPPQVPLHHRDVQRLAQRIRKVFGLVEFPLALLSRVQWHGDDGVHFPPINPASGGHL